VRCDQRSPRRIRVGLRSGVVGVLALGGSIRARGHGVRACELQCKVDQQQPCIAQPPRLLPCARVAESHARNVASSHAVAMVANG
jgi:hypothetical protein